MKALWERGKRPAEIFALLKKQFETDAPTSAKTVERHVKEWDKLRGSDFWTVRDADPAEAALVLPVLREIIELTDGQVNRATKSEAAWIARILRMRPDLQRTDAAFVVFLLAMDYAHRTQADQPQPTDDDLDYFLVFAAWPEEPEFAMTDYADLVARGIIPRARQADFLSEEAVLAATARGLASDPEYPYPDVVRLRAERGRLQRLFSRTKNQAERQHLQSQIDEQNRLISQAEAKLAVASARGSPTR
jgi:hypothetical protein